MGANQWFLGSETEFLLLSVEIDNKLAYWRQMKPKRLRSKLANVNFGQDVVIVEPVNLYKCDLGDGVRVGPFTEIQAGVQVGKRTKIQSHSFICSKVSIGEDCFIGHGVMFINDLLRDGPAAGDQNKWRDTVIGNSVSIGSNATILPVSICDNTVIGAGSVVTKDINEPGIYAGNPAKRIR